MSLVALNLEFTKKELEVLYKFSDLEPKDNRSIFSFYFNKKEIEKALINYIHQTIDITMLHGISVDDVAFSYYKEKNKEENEKSVICSECAKKYGIRKTALDLIRDETEFEISKCGVFGCDNEADYSIDFGYSENKKAVFYNVIDFSQIKTPNVEKDYDTVKITPLFYSWNLAFLCTVFTAMFDTPIDDVKKLENAIHRAIECSKIKSVEKYLRLPKKIPSSKNNVADMELYYNGICFNEYMIDDKKQPAILLCSECAEQVNDITELPDEKYEVFKSHLCGKKGCYNKGEKYFGFNDNEKIEIYLSFLPFGT